MRTMKSYVLLNTELGMGAKITEALADVDEVINIYAVYGIYDIIVEIEVDNMEMIRDITLNKIRRIDNVKNSITLLTYGDSFINE